MNRHEFTAMKDRIAAQDALIAELVKRIEALEARPALPVARVRAGSDVHA